MMNTTVGYTEYWYQNIFNQPLTKTHVDITATWNGSCVTSATGGGTFTWWSDWAYDYNGTWSSSYSCMPGSSFGYVYVNGSFHGTINPTCYHRYQPAVAQVNQQGAIDYSNSWSVTANCSGGYLHLYKFATIGG